MEVLDGSIILGSNILGSIILIVVIGANLLNEDSLCLWKVSEVVVPVKGVVVVGIDKGSGSGPTKGSIFGSGLITQSLVPGTCTYVQGTASCGPGSR